MSKSRKKKSPIIISVLVLAVLVNVVAAFASPFPLWPILTGLCAAAALVIYYRE